MSDSGVFSEIQYIGADGRPLHSDLWGGCSSEVKTMDQDYREALHSALDEWLDNSNGTGFLYIGNFDELKEEFAD